MGAQRHLRAVLTGAGLLMCIGSLTPVLGQEVGDGTVVGRITGSVTGDTVALPHAVVELTGTRRVTATADPTGLYSLVRVPSGMVAFRVLHSGYEPYEFQVLVPPGDTLHLDVHLTGNPVDLGAFHVRGEGWATNPAQPDEAPPGLSELEVEALRATSGIAEVGLVEAARRQSGNDPADPTRLLFTRGSTADLKLVLLDGAPVLAPFHLGGLLEAVESSAVGRSRLYLGGAPARYNGGISHILEIETRAPGGSGTRVRANADLISAGAFAEVPFGRGGALVSGRSLHSFGNALLADGPEPYGYYDILGRIDQRLAGGRLSITGFKNEESVHLAPAFGLTAGAAGATRLGRSRTSASWGNEALAVRFGRTVGSSRIDVTGAFSDYQARLPVGDTTLVLLTGASRRAHLAADLQIPLAWGSVGLGLSYDDVQVSELTDVVIGSPSTTASSVVTGRTTGGYAEASRNLSSGVAIRAGLRADVFEGTSDEIQLSPRLALMWPISERALFRLAAGRFSQFTRRSDLAVDSDIGVQASDFRNQALLSVASSTHLVASLDQRLTPQVTVGLEGFVKSFSGLADTEGDRLNSSGMDLRITRTSGAVQGWFGYALTWFWADTEFFSGSSFSGHHLLSAGLSGPLGGWLDGEVRFSYGSGLPFTAIPLGDRTAGEADAPTAPNDGLEAEAASGLLIPDESFLRVDVTLSGRWDFGRGEGRAWSVFPYLRVLNALDRRDSLFYYFEPWRADGPRPLAEIPLIPVVGIRVAF